MWNELKTINKRALSSIANLKGDGKAPDVLRRRVTAHSFAEAPALSDSEIRELIEAVAITPSSFNIQHWRFIAVTDRALKEKLRTIAFTQAQVVESAVTFIILADLKGYEIAQEILDRSVAVGKMDQETADQWAVMAARRYSFSAADRRDEAIRSGSMAAMALMATVADKGWVSCPMIGFNPEALHKAFDIDERYVPIMLVAVGRKPARIYPRMERLAVDEILEFNKSRIFI